MDRSNSEQCDPTQAFKDAAAKMANDTATMKVSKPLVSMAGNAINGDAIHIVKQLSQDSTLRASIAADSAKEPQVNQGLSTRDRIDAAKRSYRDINNLSVPLDWHHGDWTLTTPLI